MRAATLPGLIAAAIVLALIASFGLALAGEPSSVFLWRTLGFGV